MPGTFCALRRRRLAPVPCCVRSKATNFMMTPTARSARDQALHANDPDGLATDKGSARTALILLEVTILLREQRRDGLAVRNPENRVGKQQRDRQLDHL